MHAHIFFPVVMCCALLWWFGRGMSWVRLAVVTAVTLIIVAIVVGFERWTNLPL